MLEKELENLKMSFQTILKFFAYKDSEIKQTEKTEFFDIISEFLQKYDQCIESMKTEQIKNQKKNQVKTKGQTITHAGKGEDAMSMMVNKIKNELHKNAFE